METTEALKMANVVNAALNGKVALNADLFNMSSDATYSRRIEVKNDNGEYVGEVNIQNIHGVMLMHDTVCGPRGMISIGKQLQKADRNMHVKAHVLNIYSPGGQAHYSHELANIVNGLKKPIVGFVNQMGFSAAYHQLAATDEIMLSSELAGVGSIGTLISYDDMTEKREKEGVTYRVIRSRFSPEKAKYNFDNPSDEEIEEIQEDLIDPFAVEFQKHVHSMRPQATGKVGVLGKPGTQSGVFEGGLYHGQAAIDAGLADSIGTLDQAIERAWELSQATSYKSNNNLRNENMQFVDKANQNGTISQEDHQTAIDAVNAELTTANTTISSLQDQVKAAQLANQQLSDQVAEQTGLVAELQNEVKQLGNQNTEDPTVQGGEDLPKGKTAVSANTQKAIAEWEKRGSKKD